tara:strand:+ start:779 stop:1144 length:366 start_codon:yes stop_codon:yes gene_type:complete
MDTNFKLIKSNGDIITGAKLNWVTCNEASGGIQARHDKIDVGRSLMVDLQTLSFSELQKIMNDGYNNITNKSVYKYLTSPVVDIIDNGFDNIKFKTANETYELQINRNKNWVKSKSPISLG